MKELIKITQKNGKQLVSARELYLGLGLNKSNWSRWYPKNISNNEYFREGIDFVGVRHNDEGNEVQDFAISLDFAKHIAMMARTEKSHEYRNYFLECEKALKENVQAPRLSKELQAIFVLDNRTVEIEKRIDNIENNLPLLGVDCDEVTKTVHGVGVRLLGSKSSNAYKDKSLRRRVYTDIYGELKRQFQVRSYKAIKRCELSKAIDVINNYKLPLALDSEIFQVNNQISTEVS